MAANPPVRRFFGDARSLRSFRGSPSFHPPSIKANSLKTMKSLNIVVPSLLGLKRGAPKGSPDVGMTRIELKSNSPIVVMKEQNDRPRRLPTEVENHTSQHSRPERLQRSKSRRIIRMISTKFRTNSPPSEPGRVPVPGSDSAAKANREAALRARGLLPPLKPKDLSRLEQEQDQHIPVVNIPGETAFAVESDATQAITAANLIKQEWKAKNRPNDASASQMKNFKFGGLPSPAPSIMEEVPTSTELGPDIEADIPLPPSIIGHQEDEHMVSSSDKPETSGVLPPRHKRTLPPLALDGQPIEASDSLLTPQPPASPSETEPHRVPLPPSPLPSPKWPRIISGSKAVDFTPDGPAELPHTDSLASPQLHFPSESRPSETTPSLDNSSQTITVSTSSTSESLSSTGNAKTNMLKVMIHDHNIPVIIESPVEETPFPKDVGHDLSSAETDDKQQPAPRVQQEQMELSPATAAKADHQKTKNPVKRGQTLDPSNAVAAKERLSMLSSVRRSVVGSFRRSKSTLNMGRNQKTFNASHLPPSPTIATSFGEYARKSLSSPTRSLFPSPRPSDVGSVSSRPRLGVAPTLHSRGSILVQMNNIEDEETRRVTELAFLT